MTYRTPADMNYRKLEYKYNKDGLRIEKKLLVIDGGYTHDETIRYTLHGKNIMHIRATFNGSEMYQMHFFYDAQGRPSIMEYKEGYETNRYAYVYNLQGDVVGFLDGNGNEVVRYTYDAWRKLINTEGTLSYSVGFYNPFRYRTYVYDESTDLYYLRSRYYNPEWNRFLNADKTIKPKALLSSIYAYCANNPVIQADYSGKFYVAIELYVIALSASFLEGFDFSDTILAEKITERMRASSVVKERVANYIKAIPKGEKSYAKTEPIYWGYGDSLKKLSISDLDLALAVGHATDMTITVEKEDKGFFESLIYWGDKYKVTYTIDDLYDFDEWDGTDREAALIWFNDTFGYDPQEAGILNKYKYTCTDSYFVYAY